MHPNTYVGFVADFPDDRGDDCSAPGQELAEFILSKVASVATQVDGPHLDDGDYWSSIAVVDGISILIGIGLVGDFDTDPPRQSLVTSETEWNTLVRLFRSRAYRQKREDALRTLCRHLHQVFCADPRFSHIVWYNSETFDKPDDVPADSP